MMKASYMPDQVLQQYIKVKRKKRHFLAGCAFDLASLSKMKLTQALYDFSSIHVHGAFV